MPARLTLVCHGATAATRAARFPLDEPLEESAAAGTASLAAKLRHGDFVLTSPALRARQTAAAFSPDAVVDPALSDCDYGHWSGRAIAEVQAEDPDGIAAWLADTSAAPHGGESIAQLCRRATGWMDSRRAKNGHTIVITHAAFIRAAILSALVAPTSSFWRIDIEPLGKVDLRSDGTRWSLRAAACENRGA